MHNFRCGRPSDLPLIYKLERLYIETAEPHQLQNWLGNLERHIHQWVDDLRRTIVVQSDTKAVGYLFWEREQEIGILASVNIDPGYRRKGFASALLAEFERKAAAEGCQTLELGFLANNPARLLYEVAGYLPHREEAPYVLFRKTIAPRM